jgi:hypothetical protein
MKRRAIVGAFLIVGLWILTDLYVPRQVNLRVFDPTELARLDGEMWRSYYEKKPLKLFWQSAKLMREQVHAPFWRSFVMSYHTAKAAFLFKDGKNRADYKQALPNLEQYYGLVNELSDRPFDVKTTAQQELEWWIIRREREKHPPAEWADLQAKVAAQLYQKPAQQFGEFARLRTEAMLYRDQKNEKITEKDWQKIRTVLDSSWIALHNTLTMQ